jgi:hypothetical protein
MAGDDPTGAESASGGKDMRISIRDVLELDAMLKELESSYYAWRNIWSRHQSGEAKRPQQELNEIAQNWQKKLHAFRMRVRDLHPV